MDDEQRVAVVEMLLPHASATVTLFGNTRGKWGWTCACQTFAERNPFLESFDTRHEADLARLAHMASGLLDRLRTAEAERDAVLEAVDAATARVVAAHKYGAAVEEARDELRARAAEAEAERDRFALALDQLDMAIGDPVHPRHRHETYEDLACKLIKITDAGWDNDDEALHWQKIAARVKAEAFDEGWRAGCNETDPVIATIPNPYRAGAEQ